MYLTRIEKSYILSKAAFGMPTCAIDIGKLRPLGICEGIFELWGSRQNVELIGDGSGDLQNSAVISWYRIDDGVQ